MPFKKGKDKTGGRKSGVPNKNTTAFKELITKAYNALEEDPDYGIINWAKTNQTDFYKIASKLIPIQIQADITSSDFTLEIK